MFSDTHFHLHYISEKTGIQEASAILSGMALAGAEFGLDIGTKADDLLCRRDAVMQAIALLPAGQKDAVEKFLCFSAGIWPGVDSIKNREACVCELRSQIEAFTKPGEPFCKKLVAIGEGGIDHHWNPSGVDGRCEDDFDAGLYEGERELFMMQLSLAKELGLPFIVHSRDGFEDTLDCIKKSGYNRGIIHCFSYGIEEARTFLDMGWHIAFGGGTTYTKKSKMPQMEELLRFVPEDRLLLETDAPYLAPVPFRGQMNTPLLIRHTYDFIAKIRGISTEELCCLVDKNCAELFGIQPAGV